MTIELRKKENRERRTELECESCKYHFIIDSHLYREHETYCPYCQSDKTEIA